MTTLLTTKDVAKIVAQRGFAACFEQLVAYLEDDFRRWSQFDKTARSASHTKDGVIELMPTADSQLYSFKYVNGHPKNPALGLPTVMAFGALADVATGMPLLLSELTLTTALRTAATSVMTAKVLARSDSRTMALIGSGAQSEFQALAFHYVLGIDTLRIYDVDPQAMDKLARNLAGVTGLTIIRSDSTAQAVKGADIVTTVTADKAYATILTPDMIEPGMHINAVGGDCPGKTELHADVLHGASVFVEYEPQTRIEGDLQQMDPDFAVVEFWRVLSKEAPGRVSASQLTVFDSVGFALEDFSALRFLQDSARELNLGQTVGLIPTLADPKNLFAEFSQS